MGDGQGGGDDILAWPATTGDEKLPIGPTIGEQFTLDEDSLLIGEQQPPPPM